MSILNLKVRYFQCSTPENVPCREENFIRRELIFPLPVEQTALVLVDIWNRHFIESWEERAEVITRDIIVPLVDRAREIGLTIIHAPSPKIANKDNKYMVHTGRTKTESQTEPSWPPKEFRNREGEYAIFRGPFDQPPGEEIHYKYIRDLLDISPHIKILSSDFIIATGQQLNDLCEERKILHLLYAGFATNWCILRRDYGVRAMSLRGYDTILLREATEGLEFPDTLKKHWATELAIREVEQVHGFSASIEDFYSASNKIQK